MKVSGNNIFHFSLNYYCHSKSSDVHGYCPLCSMSVIHMKVDKIRVILSNRN